MISNSGRISWAYLVKLVEIQEEMGLRLGNKLKKIHIEFESQKMKVCLAAQALSRSVSESLQYLRINGDPFF